LNLNETWNSHDICGFHVSFDLDAHLMNLFIISRVIAIFLASAVFAVGALFIENQERIATEFMTHQELIEHVSSSNSTGYLEAFMILLIFGSIYIGIIEGLALGLRWFWKEFGKRGLD